MQDNFPTSIEYQLHDSSKQITLEEFHKMQFSDQLELLSSPSIFLRSEDKDDTSQVRALRQLLISELDKQEIATTRTFALFLCTRSKEYTSILELVVAQYFSFAQFRAFKDMAQCLTDLKELQASPFMVLIDQELLETSHWDNNTPFYVLGNNQGRKDSITALGGAFLCDYIVTDSTEQFQNKIIHLLKLLTSSAHTSATEYHFREKRNVR